MAINLHKANVYKIGWNFGGVRLLGAKFEQSNLVKISNVSSFFEFIEPIRNIINLA